MNGYKTEAFLVNWDNKTLETRLTETTSKALGKEAYKLFGQYCFNLGLAGSDYKRFFKTRAEQRVFRSKHRKRNRYVGPGGPLFNAEHLAQIFESELDAKAMKKMEVTAAYFTNLILAHTATFFSIQTWGSEIVGAEVSDKTKPDAAAKLLH